jgi:hypothetical protein
MSKNTDRQFQEAKGRGEAMTASTPVLVKQSEVPERGLVIVTARSSDPHLLRPFVVSVKDERRGTASAVGYFTAESSALRAHDSLVRRLTEFSPAAGASAEPTE